MPKGIRRFFNRSLPKNRRERQDTIRRVGEVEIPFPDPPTKGDEIELAPDGTIALKNFSDLPNQLRRAYQLHDIHSELKEDEKVNTNE